jgi:hypothetical protein
MDDRDKPDHDVLACSRLWEQRLDRLGAYLDATAEEPDPLAD